MSAPTVDQAIGLALLLAPVAAVIRAVEPRAHRQARRADRDLAAADRERAGVRRALAETGGVR